MYLVVVFTVFSPAGRAAALGNAQFLPLQQTGVVTADTHFT
jgi:hypothetical protein